MQETNLAAVRLQIDNTISEKIAVLRFNAQLRGDEGCSLSAVVEDAIEFYFECLFEGREMRSPGQYVPFLKLI